MENPQKNIFQYNFSKMIIILPRNSTFFDLFYGPHFGTSSLAPPSGPLFGTPFRNQPLWHPFETPFRDPALRDPLHDPLPLPIRIPFWTHFPHLLLDPLPNPSLGTPAFETGGVKILNKSSIFNKFFNKFFNKIYRKIY